MSFNTIYKRLVEVKILHNYFLNTGETAFSTMNATEQRDQLKLYNISEYIEISPTQETIDKMAGHKLLFKPYKSGFSIFCKVDSNNQGAPFILLPDTLHITIAVKIKDTFFGNYTELTPNSKDIFYFGNTKPNTEGIGFEFIARSNQNKLVSDSYKLSEAGKTVLIEQLGVKNSQEIFGIIQLHMIGDTDDLSLLNAQGELKNPLPVFKIQFNNRDTFWRYRRSTDNSEIFTTAQKQPLTKSGFVEVTHNGDKFPNPNANQVIPDNNNFFSETYI